MSNSLNSIAHSAIHLVAIRLLITCRKSLSVKKTEDHCVVLEVCLKLMGYCNQSEGELFHW